MTTPIRRWVDGDPPVDAPDPAMMAQFLARGETRTVRRDGIQWKGLLYHDPLLVEQSLIGRKAFVCYPLHRRDYIAVFVDGDFVAEVGLARDLTAAQHRQIRSANRVTYRIARGLLDAGVERRDDGAAKARDDDTPIWDQDLTESPRRDIAASHAGYDLLVDDEDDEQEVA